jgi:hypothetical protein
MTEKEALTEIELRRVPARGGGYGAFFRIGHAWYGSRPWLLQSRGFRDFATYQLGGQWIYHRPPLC